MNKTKPSIVESYIKLIDDEKYDKVSITDLVSENQVSRQTFYYHFDDINDMLDWAFRQELKNACEEMEYGETLEECFAPVLATIKKYHNLVKKATKADDLIFIYNLFYKFFKRFVKEYIIEKSPLQSYDNYDFIIETWSYALAAKVLKEARGRRSNYDAMFTDCLNKFKKFVA